MRKVQLPAALALITGVAIAAFAIGFAASSLSRPRPPAPRRHGEDAFLDEMSAINAEYGARLDDAMRERGDDETCREMCRAWRVHYDESVRACYHRHKKPLPPHLR